MQEYVLIRLTIVFGQGNTDLASYASPMGQGQSGLPGFPGANGDKKNEVIYSAEMNRINQRKRNGSPWYPHELEKRSERAHQQQASCHKVCLLTVFQSVSFYTLQVEAVQDGAH